jgi:hypothetical protein
VTGQKLNFDGKMLAVYGPFVKTRFEIPEEDLRRSALDTPLRECTCELCRKLRIESRNSLELNHQLDACHEAAPNILRG